MGQPAGQAARRGGTVNRYTFAALALTAAALSCERGRGIVASALIRAGAGMLPDPPVDLEREARIRARIMGAIRRDSGQGCPI